MAPYRPLCSVLYSGAGEALYLPLCVRFFTAGGACWLFTVTLSSVLYNSGRAALCRPLFSN